MSFEDRLVRPARPKSPGLAVFAGVVAGLAFLMMLVSVALGGNSGLIAIRSVAHPVLFGLVFLLAATTSVVAAVAERRAAIITASAGGAAVAVLFAAARIIDAGSYDEPDRPYQSPDGRYVLVVDHWSAMIDPMWDLVLEQKSGATSRYWRFGCVNGDYDGLSSVRWVSNSELAITVDDGEKRVKISAAGPGPVDPALRSCRGSYS
ncbi:hypothetical protein V3G39_03615 [Dermatophilaceae bacterium Sec6.4]